MTTPSIPAKRTGLRILSVVVAVLVVSSVAIAPAAASEDARESFDVVVDSNGDADVSVTLTFDLEDDDEHDAFDHLRDDEDAKADFRDRFEDRLADIASDAETDVDRDMAVTDASIDLSVVDETGVVELSVRWHGLAAVDAGTVTITEPFASGFTPDQQFVLVGPDGATVDSATPSPDSQADATLVWNAGSDLDGFEVRFVDEGAGGDAHGDGEPDTVGSAAGFGAVLALVSLLSAMAIAVSRAE